MWHSLATVGSGEEVLAQDNMVTKLQQRKEMQGSCLMKFNWYRIKSLDHLDRIDILTILSFFIS